MKASTATATECVGLVMSRRDASWVLRRCVRRGHVPPYLADPQVRRETGPLADSHGPLPMLRCGGCGTWVTPTNVAVAEVVGSAKGPASLGDLPLAARGRMDADSACCAWWPSSGSLSRPDRWGNSWGAHHGLLNVAEGSTT